MKNLRLIKNVITTALIVLAVFTVYSIVTFSLGDSWSAWGLGKILSLFVSLLRYVFFATILYLIPPILIYWLLLIAIKNPVIRMAAGVGCVYIFWQLGGGSGLFAWSSLSTPLDTAIKIVRMSAQIYLLVVLVMPIELMSILGTIAATVGSIAIDIFPDAPGSWDDIAAICTLTAMIFVYLNTLAMLLKRYSGKVINAISSRIKPASDKQPVFVGFNDKSSKRSSGSAFTNMINRRNK